MKYFKVLSILLLGFYSCNSQEKTPETSTIEQETPVRAMINPNGATIKDRFLPPDGFQRISSPNHTFGSYLQNLPLKEKGSKVHLYDGSLKSYQAAAIAVVDMDVGKRDLQQCADAIMRLRAEYLYEKKDYNKLHFNFTNGFNATYKKWKEGYRIKVSGNKVTWQKQASPSTDYQSFRKYLNMVFAYAGTLSLAKELEPVSLKDIQTGDVFIQGGSPGHAVIVVDVVENKSTGERQFLLAQSYMPAQEIHVLANPNNEKDNPWYSNLTSGDIETPEWTFGKGDLKRFPK